MNKIVFSDNSELQITETSQTANDLLITIDTSNVNELSEKFQDKTLTKVMRYYSGIDLIRGYSGYINLKNISFTPGVTVSVDYSIEDPSTESGFSEKKVDRCIVTMEKTSMLASVAGQTAQNTANIDYLAMEAGIEL